MTQDHVERRRMRVNGVVQGVGFRPLVYRLATGMGLSGFVLNDSEGVLIEVEGNSSAVDAFRTALVRQLPPLAIVESVREEPIEAKGGRSFEIRESARLGTARTPISADIATCVACLGEMADRRDRRYAYAFTNCTDCGPRFTITKSIPYDRPNTTMAGFSMCPACRSEYENPADRRFHAQPIACPRCGPALTFIGGGDDAAGPVTEAAAAIGEGLIVAVKGLGGYHLSCDATSEAAVRRLRRRKNREEKPFAVMVSSVADARQIAAVTEGEAGVLESVRRPIVLLRRIEGAPLADAVAPSNRFVGVMLPYTPLHHILLAATARPVVMTSGNTSDEPIAFEDEDALHRLAGIADAFLVHNRPIHIRCDDSVVRVVGGDMYPVRRSRGFAPQPLSVSQPFVRPTIAVGAELKNTFCIGVEGRAILSQHIGDLENYEAMSAFERGVDHFLRIFEVAPEVVAHDLHPEYMSTKWALQREEVRTVGVQHHHAHIAACLADNGRFDRVIGLALDGTGYGPDGTIWGCEVLTCDARAFERAMHLRVLPMPGGAAAIREPWRMAAVYLDAAFGGGAGELPLDFVAATAHRWGPVLAMARADINCPSTSSAGRLFDAAAALCGLRTRVSYEGQAAAEFEQMADPDVDAAYPCGIDGGELDGVELIAALAEDLVRGRPAAHASAAFHNGLASSLVRSCEQVREQSGLSTIALSGGTWQNILMLERVHRLLSRSGFEVLTHRRVPPTDGGISLGQAVVANAQAHPC
jgi:hydrogenase maturation protein HypF